MNKKFAPEDIAKQLAERCKLPQAITDNFLQEYFAIIAEGLIEDGYVEVEGLGSFERIHVEERKIETPDHLGIRVIPAHDRIRFTAVSELAERVNEPFAMFETVILEEEHIKIEPIEEAAQIYYEEKPLEDIPLPIGVELSEEPVVGSLLQPELGSSEENNESLIAEIQATATPVIDKIVVVEMVTEVVVQEENEEIIAEPIEQFSTSEAVTAYVVAPTLVETQSERSLPIKEYLLAVGITIAVCAAALVGLYATGVLDGVLLQQSNVEVEEITPTYPTEVAREIPPTPPAAVESPKAEPTFETIRQGVMLTSLSLKHYGNKFFWCYIYEENRAIIKNPNLIPLGTRLEIAPPEKYGIDPKDRASIDKAKAKCEELARTYR